MCLLTFLPPGVLPDLTALGHGAAVNDDGHGYAIVVDNEVLVRRGMRAEAIIASFDAARRRHPQGPALFHSRLGTGGRRCPANCHPFPVGGDRRTVLAHNGVLPAVVQPARGDPRSDTRITAEEFLPEFGSLRSRRTRLRLERWMTPGNKMVILTVDRRFRQRAYILNESSGVWAGGIWYSNDGYLPPPPMPAAADTQALWGWSSRTPWDWAIDRCAHCHATVSAADNACWCCGWYLDRWDPFADDTCSESAATALTRDR